MTKIRCRDAYGRLKSPRFILDWYNRRVLTREKGASLNGGRFGHLNVVECRGTRLKVGVAVI